MHTKTESPRQSFMEQYSRTKENGLRFSKGLFAATSAGLLASILMAAQLSSSTVQEPSISATAQILQRCSMQLPALQKSAVSQSLDEWSPMWLATDANRSAEEKTEFCAQLLSASIQGPTLGDAQNEPAFAESLQEAKQLMLIQIADQVLESTQVAEDVAPLMGLAPSDVQHYFKAVKQGSPLQESGPTPQAGPHFSV